MWQHFLGFDQKHYLKSKNYVNWFWRKIFFRAEGIFCCQLEMILSVRYQVKLHYLLGWANTSFGTGHVIAQLFPFFIIFQNPQNKINYLINQFYNCNTHCSARWIRVVILKNVLVAPNWKYSPSFDRNRFYRTILFVGVFRTDCILFHRLKQTVTKICSMIAFYIADDLKSTRRTQTHVECVRFSSCSYIESNRHET